MTDHFRTTELRDRADDLVLGERDRAERQAWLEGQAEDRMLWESLNAELDACGDPWGPGPLDLEPWEPIVVRLGRRGQ